ncbi:MAG: hypothetical protein ACUVQD_06825 [Thermaceae bacterium]
MEPSPLVERVLSMAQGQRVHILVRAEGRMWEVKGGSPKEIGPDYIIEAFTKALSTYVGPAAEGLVKKLGPKGAWERALSLIPGKEREEAKRRLGWVKVLFP